MYRVLHFILIAFYLGAPVIALVGDAIVSIRKRRGAPSSQLVMTTSAAVVLGTSLALIYAIGVGGHVGLGQIFLCIYFAAGLLLLLKGFDWLIMRASTRALRRALESPKPMPRRLALAGQGLLRVALLIGLGLPYIMSAIMTYRPKVVPRENPLTLLKTQYETVAFRSSDGVRLSGWWIPAIKPSVPEADFGTRTVIVCHGLAANKSNQLIMAGPFLLNGYNVLIFDFRAHGESGGQLTSLGDLERRDVLAAVRWLREYRPLQSQRIYGVGISMGAAALIEAAADPSDEGQAIEAVAVYSTFDDLQLLARDIAKERFLPPFDRIVRVLGLPMAGAQVGTNLPSFAPGKDIMKLWPRPVMVLHGESDQIIPFNRGMRLHKQALQPKRHLWIPDTDHDRILDDTEAANEIRKFFDNAKPQQML